MLLTKQEILMAQVVLAQAEAEGLVRYQPQQYPGIMDPLPERPLPSAITATLDAIRTQLDGLWALAQLHAEMPELDNDQVHEALTALYNAILKPKFLCPCCDSEHEWGFMSPTCEYYPQGERPEFAVTHGH